MKKRVLFLMALLILALSFTLVACTPDKVDDVVTITLSKTTVALQEGASETITAKVSVGGLAVVWESADSAIATVVDGKITAIAEGVVKIKAKVGAVTEICTVTVSKKPAPPIQPTAPTIVEQEGYDGQLYFSNYLAPDKANLLEGLTAKDYLGNALTVQVENNGGFDVSSLGSYTVTYKAIDTANNLSASFQRKVFVTYYGIEKDTLNNATASTLSQWTYVADSEEAKTATQWKQQVVGGHSSNWNKFEGPTGMQCVVMHGSDTNGREALGSEVDDEYPNTMLWNKVAVGQDNTIFRVFCSNNPYPDFNNLLSRFRVSVLNLDTWKTEIVSDYKDVKAKLAADKKGLDYDAMRTKTYFDFDMSKYAGKTVVVFIEQDAHNNVYQRDYYLDIGYLDFQVDALITETRDTLVMYSMGFVKPEEKLDYSKLVLDESSVWGTSDSDFTRWGLRGDIAAKSKWTEKWLNSATGSIGYKNDLGGGIQLIAREPSDKRDGNLIVRDAVLMNRIKVQQNFFEIYIGTDTDATSVNYRLTIVLSDGKEVHLKPLYNVDGYTPSDSQWGQVQKSQWTTGLKLLYDLTMYKGQEIVMLIETDEIVETGVGNCTLWFNRAEFLSKLNVTPADYTAYDALKAQVASANYVEADYTELSWTRYSVALTDFNAVLKTLVNEEQSIINNAVTKLQNAITGLEKKVPPIVVPSDPTSGTLGESVCGFTDAQWKGLGVDGSGKWGTDSTRGEEWGFRGDPASKAKWLWLKANNGLLNHTDNIGATLQSIAYESGNDAQGWGADAVFANKVWVRENNFRIYVGCDNATDTVNVRVRVILADGTFVTITPKSSPSEYTAAQNGWGTVKIGQWVYGAELVYDFTAYNNKVITILIEQDQNETEQGTSCTMWFNKAEFIA